MDCTGISLLVILSILIIIGLVNLFITRPFKVAMKEIGRQILLIIGGIVLFVLLLIGTKYIVGLFMYC